MSTRYTNRTNIPFSVAVWLATDFYDGNSADPNTYSATTLLKPIQQIVLSRRLDQRILDVSDLLASSIGSSFHDSIEQSWRHANVKNVIAQLGIAKDVIDKIVINPTEPIKEGDIPIYLEQRITKKLGKFTVTGKFDFVGSGILEDHKSTSVYNWMNGNQDEKYKMQGSIYRWIAPHIITQNQMRINFLFTDWKKVDRYKKDYPKNKVDNRIYTLEPMGKIELFLKEKLEAIDAAMTLPSDQLPQCTDEELWRGKPEYKYYADPTKTVRSTKNFDNYLDALRHRDSKGVGIVLEVKGKVRACLYCSAYAACKQKDQLIRDGLLIVE